MICSSYVHCLCDWLQVITCALHNPCTGNFFIVDTVIKILNELEISSPVVILESAMIEPFFFMLVRIQIQMFYK